MIKRILLAAVLLWLLGLTVFVFKSPKSDSDAQLQTQISALEERVEQLSQEVTHLRAEIAKNSEDEGTSVVASSVLAAPSSASNEGNSTIVKTESLESESPEPEFDNDAANDEEQVLGDTSEQSNATTMKSVSSDVADNTPLYTAFEFETMLFNLFGSDSALMEIGLSNVSCEDNRCDLSFSGESVENIMLASQYLESALGDMPGELLNSINITQDQHGEATIQMDVKLLPNQSN